MKLVVQRVKSAQVSLENTGEVVGKIGKGLFVLVGVGGEDSEIQVKKIAEKLVNLRIMSDKDSKMNLSVLDTDSEILVVSQFTLYADISGGNRPSFTTAAKPEKAMGIYELFIAELKNLGVKAQTGKFGEYMNIHADLDGPVTILI